MIEGLVATIIDTRRLALNIGSKQGVKKGMVFEIYSKQTITIKDPETNDVLGDVDIPKTQVQITDVKEGFSVAQTFKKKNVNVGGVIDVFSSSRLLSPPKYVEKYETLANDEDIKPLSPEDSKVQVGDRAVQVQP